MRAGWVSNGSGLIHRGRVNLLSTRSQADVIRVLASRSRGPAWGQLLEEAAWLVVDRHRQGRPAMLLRDAEPPPGGGALLPPLLMTSDPVILFGDGGSSKSYLGLAAAMSVHSGLPLLAGLQPTTPVRTAYLDWEWTGWPHKKRMRALWEPEELPDLVYIPCAAEGPLVHQVDRLRRVFAEREIKYAVIDSVALACSGPPEEAEVALAFYQALAALEVGSLSLAHITKAGDTEKPFGSAFWHNSTRGSWFVRGIPANGTGTVQEAKNGLNGTPPEPSKNGPPRGTGHLLVELLNRKCQEGPLLPPINLRISFSSTRTTIIPAESPTPPSGHLRDRIRGAIRIRAKTREALALELGVTPSMVKKVVWTGRSTDFDDLPPEPGSRARLVGLRGHRYRYRSPIGTGTDGVPDGGTGTPPPSPIGGVPVPPDPNPVKEKVLL